jgi:hypothetical protein
VQAQALHGGGRVPQVEAAPAVQGTAQAVSGAAPTRACEGDAKTWPASHTARKQGCRGCRPPPPPAPGQQALPFPAAGVGGSIAQQAQRARTVRCCQMQG